MWEQVKPIKLILEQNNEDNTTFWMEFYSYDSELVKLNEAKHYSSDNQLLGEYSRILGPQKNSKYDPHFFVSKLKIETTTKLIQYYENPDLYLEYIL